MKASEVIGLIMFGMAIAALLFMAIGVFMMPSSTAITYQNAIIRCPNEEIIEGVPTEVHANNGIYCITINGIEYQTGANNVLVYK